MLGGVLQAPSPFAGSEQKVNGALSTLSNCCFCDSLGTQGTQLFSLHCSREATCSLMSVSSTPGTSLRILFSLANIFILVSYPQEIDLSIFLESSRSMLRLSVY